MKMKNLSLICALSITVLVVASGFAQEVNTMPAQAESAMDMDIPDFVGDIVDPSFGRYVNFDAISVAWANQDPALLTDCALELAEAERILFRELKTLTSGALLNKAIMLAADQKDVETLDRVIRYATNAKKDELLAVATSAKRLAGEERVILPFFTIDLLSTSVQNYSLLKSVINDINKERANGNKALLAALADLIAKNVDLNTVLKNAEVDSLKKYAEASEKAIGESDASSKATEEILDRLVGEERSFLPGWVGIRDKIVGAGDDAARGLHDIVRLPTSINRAVNSADQTIRKTGNTIESYDSRQLPDNLAQNREIQKMNERLKQQEAKFKQEVQNMQAAAQRQQQLMQQQQQQQQVHDFGSALGQGIGLLIQQGVQQRQQRQQQQYRSW